MGQRIGRRCKGRHRESRKRLNIVEYSKLDSRLATALSGDDSARYAVFLCVEGSLARAELQQLLKAYGVTVPDSGDIVTALLSRQAIDQLSHASWIRYIELSGTVYPRSAEE